MITCRKTALKGRFRVPIGDLFAPCGILVANQKLAAAEIFSGITFRAVQALGFTHGGRLVPNDLYNASTFPTHV